MKIVNSFSGGKTSAYLDYHFPGDVTIFSLVRIKGNQYKPKDIGLKQEIEKRIPDFEGTAESDLTLRTVLDYEQFSGKKITWVTSNYTFDSLIDKKKFLPNHHNRYCTYELKILPIFEYCYKYLLESKNDKIKMQIGYRIDEADRAFEWEIKEKDTIKYPLQSSISSKRNKNTDLNWRITAFPLIDNCITKYMVSDFWKNKLDFPIVSNCVGCHFHTKNELRLQAKVEPIKLNWWIERERERGNKFKKEFWYEDLLGEEFLPSFDDELFLTGRKSCSSGICGV